MLAKIQKREEQTDSIDGAVYELKLELEDYERTDKFEPQNIVEDILQKRLTRFADKARGVINAIEDSMDKPEEEKRSEEENPKSIWKDVSELPTEEVLSVIVELKNGEKCFANWKNGRFIEVGYVYGFSPKEIKYCTLTDFINAFEQMQKDINQLKKNNYAK